MADSGGTCETSDFKVLYRPETNACLSASCIQIDLSTINGSFSNIFTDPTRVLTFGLGSNPGCEVCGTLEY